MNRTLTSRLAARFAVAWFVAIVPVIAACGARGPLDDDSVLDASTSGSDVGTGDMSRIPDASSPSVDASVDSAPEGGSIVVCGACLIQSCGADILKCVQATGCRTTLQCVATTCLGGGTSDPACLFNCASGDPAGALQIFQIFQCVTGKCGGDCASVLGGIGGGGMAQQPHPFARVLYARWPELVSR